MKIVVSEIRAINLFTSDPGDAPAAAQLGFFSAPFLRLFLAQQSLGALPPEDELSAEMTLEKRFRVSSITHGYAGPIARGRAFSGAATSFPIHIPLRRAPSGLFCFPVRVAMQARSRRGGYPQGPASKRLRHRQAKACLRFWDQGWVHTAVADNCKRGSNAHPRVAPR